MPLQTYVFILANVICAITKRLIKETLVLATSKHEIYIFMFVFNNKVSLFLAFIYFYFFGGKGLVVDNT